MGHPVSLHQGYRGQGPAVAVLSAQAGAAVAEIEILFRAGIGARDGNLRDAERGEARSDIALEIETGPLAGARRREPACVVSVRPFEPLAELGPDLVGRLTDTGPDGGGDPSPDGTQRFHRRDRSGEHAVQRAAPAGMGGADNSGAGIGEQDRRAIGRQDAERDSGGGRRQRVPCRRGAPRESSTIACVPCTCRAV